MMTYDLAVLGDLVADLIIPVERLPIEPNQHGWAEGIYVEAGGAGNVMIAARRVNLDTVSVGPIGGDYYGAEMLNMLRDTGVHVEHVTIHQDRKTVLCMVLTDVAGQHVYLGVKDQRGRWPFHPDWHTVIRSSRALFSDGYTLRDVFEPDDTLAALTTARKAGVPVFFDPGPSIMFVSPELMAATLALSDVVLITDEEAARICDAPDRAIVAQALLELGPTTVVIKHGGDGCTIANATMTRHYPGFHVPVVDTVGAGDSFAAAFIAGWLRGGSIDDCATLANAMGAMAVTQRGAGTRIPARERLLELLANSPRAYALA